MRVCRICLVKSVVLLSASSQFYWRVVSLIGERSKLNRSSGNRGHGREVAKGDELITEKNKVFLVKRQCLLLEGPGVAGRYGGQPRCELLVCSSPHGSHFAPCAACPRLDLKCGG